MAGENKKKPRKSRKDKGKKRKPRTKTPYLQTGSIQMKNIGTNITQLVGLMSRPHAPNAPTYPEGQQGLVTIQKELTELSKAFKADVEERFQAQQAVKKLTTGQFEEGQEERPEVDIDQRLEDREAEVVAREKKKFEDVIREAKYVAGQDLTEAEKRAELEKNYRQRQERYIAKRDKVKELAKAGEPETKKILLGIGMGYDPTKTLLENKERYLKANLLQKNTAYKVQKGKIVFTLPPPTEEYKPLGIQITRIGVRKEDRPEAMPQVAESMPQVAEAKGKKKKVTINESENKVETMAREDKPVPQDLKQSGYKKEIQEQFVTNLLAQKREKEQFESQRPTIPTAQPLPIRKPIRSNIYTSEEESEYERPTAPIARKKWTPPKSAYYYTSEEEEPPKTFRPPPIKTSEEALEPMMSPNMARVPAPPRYRPTSEMEVQTEPLVSGIASVIPDKFESATQTAPPLPKRKGVMSVQTEPLEETQEIARLSAVLQDLTTQVKRQQELRTALEQQNRLQQISEFQQQPQQSAFDLLQSRLQRGRQTSSQTDFVGTEIQTQTEAPSRGEFGTMTEAPSRGEFGTMTEAPSRGEMGTMTEAKYRLIVRPERREIQVQTDPLVQGIVNPITRYEMSVQTEPPERGEMETQTEREQRVLRRQLGIQTEFTPRMDTGFQTEAPMRGEIFTQTEAPPTRGEMETQTEREQRVLRRQLGIQTDPVIQGIVNPIIRNEMETQTEAPPMRGEIGTMTEREQRVLRRQLGIQTEAQERGDIFTQTEAPPTRGEMETQTEKEQRVLKRQLGIQTELLPRTEIQTQTEPLVDLQGGVEEVSEERARQFASERRQPPRRPKSRREYVPAQPDVPLLFNAPIRPPNAPEREELARAEEIAKLEQEQYDYPVTIPPRQPRAKPPPVRPTVSAIPSISVIEPPQNPLQEEDMSRLLRRELSRSTDEGFNLLRSPSAESVLSAVSGSSEVSSMNEGDWDYLISEFGGVRPPPSTRPRQQQVMEMAPKRIARPPPASGRGRGRGKGERGGAAAEIPESIPEEETIDNRIDNLIETLTKPEQRLKVKIQATNRILDLIDKSKLTKKQKIEKLFVVDSEFKSGNEKLLTKITELIESLPPSEREQYLEG